MRIVHGLHWSQGGIVKFLELLLSNISVPEAEHYVIVMNSVAGANLELNNNSRACYYLNWDKCKISALTRFNHLIKELNPDIFHSHSFLPGVIGRILLPAKTICMTTIHNDYPHYRDITIRSRIKNSIEYQSLKRRCQSVVCVSESVRQLVDLAMPGLPLETINNGVPLGRLQGSVKHQQKDSFTIMSMGRLDDQKGYDVLLAAFSILHKQNIEAKLRIIGEGLLRPKLEEQIQNLDIREHVSLPGFSDNPIEEFEKADIFVCSSYYEGFSLAVAEAMAFGLPVVTTRTGGVASMVRDGVEASIVPINDSAELARAIIDLINNATLRHNLAENAKLFAEKNFDIRETALRYERIYERLLG